MASLSRKGSPVNVHPAQKAFADAKREVGRQSRGASAVDPGLLAYGVLWAEVDSCTEDDLRVVNGLLRRTSTANLREIRLLLGVQVAATNLDVRNATGDVTALMPRRRFHRGHRGEKALVLRPEPNLQLGIALKIALKADLGRLKNLELIGIKFGPEAMREVRAGLGQARGLERISFRGSKIGDTAFAELYEGLGSNETIQMLTLSACDLTDKSAGGVGHILRCHAQRRNDKRWGKSLRRTGLEEATLLSMEEYNQVAMTGLLAVDLSNNNCGDGLARALAHEIAADDWLGAINLSGNSIGRAGTESLLDAMEQSNDALAILDLRDNIDREGTSRIDAFLRARNNLPNAGFLMRPIPEENSMSIPCASSIIASAIVKWQSGHQVSSSLTSLIASLGILFEDDPFSVLIPDDIDYRPTRGAHIRSHSTGRENHQPNKQASRAYENHTKPPMVARTKLSSQQRDHSTRRAVSQNPRAAKSNDTFSRLQHPAEAKFISSAGLPVGESLKSSSSSMTKRRPSSRKPSMTSTSSKKPSSRSSSLKSGRKKVDKAAYVAQLFAQEVDKAIAEYTTNMNESEVSLIRSNTAAMDLLEKSVQELNEQLDNHPRSPVPDPNSSLEAAPHDSVQGREAEYLSSEFEADALAQNVAARLSELWHS